MSSFNLAESMEEVRSMMTEGKEKNPCYRNVKYYGEHVLAKKHQLRGGWKRR